MEEEPEAKRPKPEAPPAKALSGRQLEAALSGASGFPCRMPQLPDLGVPAQLALACRILAASGFALDVAGHITVKRPGDDGSMWCTPYGVFWRDISAGDILVIDQDGTVLAGPWDVTPATAIHTELHRARNDIEVVVHNHPYYGSLLSALHLVPEFADWQAIMFDGDIALFNEYGGAVDTVEEGQKLAHALGSATAVILANHGVLITGESVAQATYRAVSFERTCQLHYEAMAASRNLVPVLQTSRNLLKRSLNTISVDNFWRNEARKAFRSFPDILGEGCAGLPAEGQRVPAAPPAGAASPTALRVAVPGATTTRQHGETRMIRKEEPVAGKMASGMKGPKKVAGTKINKDRKDERKDGKSRSVGGKFVAAARKTKKDNKVKKKKKEKDKKAEKEDTERSKHKGKDKRGKHDGEKKKEWKGKQVDETKAPASVGGKESGAAIPPCVLKVLPEDAPAGHEAWVRAKYCDGASPCVKFCYRSETFYVAAKMSGGRAAAERLARALYVKCMQGCSREEVLQSRKDIYEAIKKAMRLSPFLLAR